MGMQLKPIRAFCQNPIAIQSLNELETHKTDEELEDEITTLAANINAATYRLLVLIAEFDLRGAWRGWGYKSCAHWLNVRCGIGMAAARDRVRVACALQALPKTSAAFADGKLSFSKAREMTRIANEDNEDYLLMIAEFGSAHHVAELVRKYRGVQRREASRKAMTQQAERELNYYWDEDGCLNVTARIPPEQGAVLVQALQTALEHIEFVDDEPAEPKINAENATAVAFLQEEQRKKKSNGPRQRADAMMLLADHYLQTPASDESPAEFKTADRFQVMVHVDVETLIDDVESSAISREHQHCELENGPALAIDTVKRLCCDSSLLVIHKDADGNPLNIGRKTRVIPAAMRRALIVRDKGCVFPGCTCRSTRYVDGHHIQHWADGGETSLDNLALLCRHHHRLVHEGGFDVCREQDGRLLFRRADGRELRSTAPVVELSNLIEDINRWHNKRIDQTTVFRQQDSSIDYAMAVDGLLQRSKHRNSDYFIPIASTSA